MTPEPGEVVSQDDIDTKVDPAVSGSRLEASWEQASLEQTRARSSTPGGGSVPPTLPPPPPSAAPPPPVSSTPGDSFVMPNLSGIQEWFAQDKGKDSDTLASLPPLSLSLPRIGDVFAGHKIEKMLGRGGMGAVFVGVDARGIKRAIKVSLYGAEQDAQMTERFRREVQALATLPRHPNVLNVQGAGEERGYAFYITEYVDGTPLDQVLKRGEITTDRALKIGAKLARALGHVHKHGIVHRDVKPANILVRKSDGQPILIDFGIARRSEQERLTNTGDVIGSPNYMSPEQASGAKAVDGRTDIFSLGSLIYELLTGVQPFVGKSPVAIMTKIIRESPDLPSVSRQGLPVELDDVVMKALEKSPNDRYASADEFAAELERARRGGTIWPKLTLPMRLAIIAIFVGAVAIVGLLIVAGIRSGRRAAWRVEAEAKRGTLENERRAFHGVWYGLAAPVASWTALEHAQGLLGDSRAPSAGDPTRDSLARSCALAQVEASLAASVPEKARPALAQLPADDPDGALLGLIVETAAEPMHSDALSAALRGLQAVAPSEAPSQQLATLLALTRAEARLGSGASALHRLEGVTPSRFMVDPGEARAAIARAATLALAAACRKATTPEELGAALARAGEGELSKAELVAIALKENPRPSVVLRKLYDTEPGLFDQRVAAPTLNDWAQEAVATGKGDVSRALALVSRARALDESVVPSPAIAEALEARGRALIDAHKGDEWLALALDALRAGYCVDAAAWPLDDLIGFPKDSFTPWLEKRLATDPSDWAAKLCYVARPQLLEAEGEGGVGAPRSGVEPDRIVALADEILHVADLPRAARALATEIRTQAQLRIERRNVIGIDGYSALAVSSAADCEKASELGGPSRCRLLFTAAFLRLFDKDRKHVGTLEVCRRAIAAADDRAAADQRGWFPEATVLDGPWHDVQLRASRLDTRLLLIFVLVLNDDPHETDVRVGEMSEIDTERDRASIGSAFVHFMRQEPDLGLAELDSAWNACAARKDAWAPTARNRFAEWVQIVNTQLRLHDRADMADRIVAELKRLRTQGH